MLIGQRRDDFFLIFLCEKGKITHSRVTMASRLEIVDEEFIE